MPLVKETPFTDEQKAQAESMQRDIVALLEENKKHKQKLDTNFVDIGVRLDAVRSGQYWRLFQFKNLSAYMNSLESRTQNYHCMGVARDLLPLIPAEDLLAMGLGKARLLRLMVKGKKPITTELVTAAKQKSREELEGLVHVALGLVKDDSPGKYFSLGGFKMVDEERGEFLRAVNLAVAVADLGNTKIVNWQKELAWRRKGVIQAFIAEFIATYAADLSDPVLAAVPGIDEEEEEDECE